MTRKDSEEAYDQYMLTQNPDTLDQLQKQLN